MLKVDDKKKIDFNGSDWVNMGETNGVPFSTGIWPLCSITHKYTII